MAAEAEYKQLLECTFVPNARGKPAPVPQPEVGGESAWQSCAEPVPCGNWFGGVDGLSRRWVGGST